MTSFFDVFSTTQQFLILQGYADEILTEAELMTFVMLSTDDHRFAYVVPKGVYLVSPAISLDDFSHQFFKKEEVSVQLKRSQIHLHMGKKSSVATFSDDLEAQGVYKDIQYLFDPNISD